MSQYHETGDAAALQPLVTAHMAFALKEIKPFTIKYPHLKADLESAAFLGLTKAATKYDPKKGFQFSTYARWWVKAAVHEEIFDSQSILSIPMTHENKKAISGYRKNMDRLKIEHPNLPEEDLEMILADEMKMNYEQFRSLRRLITGGVVSMDAQIRQGDDGATIGNLLPSEDPTPEDLYEEAQNADFLKQCINKTLEAMVEDGPAHQRDSLMRQRDILIRRRLKEEPETLEEIGADYGVSRERVRQVENKALEMFTSKLRRVMSNQDRPALSVLEVA